MSAFDSRKIVLGAGAQVGAQFLIALLSFLTLKILTTALGPGEYGVFGTVITLVGVVSLLTDLGVNAVTAREIVKRPDDARAIMGDNIALRLVLCAVLIPTTSVIAVVAYGSLHPQIGVLALVASGLMLCDSIRAVCLAYFTAHVQNYVLAIVYLSQQVLITSGAVVVSTTSAGPAGAICAYVVGNAVGAVAAAVLVSRAARPSVRFRPKRWTAILRTSVPLGAIQAVNVMLLRADVILLSILSGPSSVATYLVAYAFITAANTVPSYLMTALMPSLVRADADQLARIVRRGAQYVALAACLMAAVIVCCREDLVLVVSGPRYAAAAGALGVLACASVFTWMNAVAGFASVALDVHHRLIFVSVGALVVNVLLNLATIPRWGILGAAASTAFTEAVACSVVWAHLRLRTGIKISLVRPLLKPVGALLVAIVTTFLISGSWGTLGPVWSLALAGVCSAGLYLGTAAMLRTVPIPRLRKPPQAGLA